MNSFTNWNGELYHSGTKGMKWGIRRYQNPDGTLTEEGKRRYAHPNKRAIKNGYQNADGSYTDKGLERFTKSARRIRNTNEIIERDYANFAAEKKWQDSRAEKFRQKGKTEKANTAASKSSVAQKYMSTIKSNQQKLLAKAYQKNFDVVAKDKQRLGAAHSTQLARELLGGALGSLAVSAITRGKDLELVTGKKLYVKRNG